MRNLNLFFYVFIVILMGCGTNPSVLTPVEQSKTTGLKRLSSSNNDYLLILSVHNLTGSAYLQDTHTDKFKYKIYDHMVSKLPSHDFIFVEELGPRVWDENINLIPLNNRYKHLSKLVNKKYKGITFISSNSQILIFDSSGKLVLDDIEKDRRVLDGYGSDYNKGLENRANVVISTIERYRKLFTNITFGERFKRDIFHFTQKNSSFEKFILLISGERSKWVTNPTSEIFNEQISKIPLDYGILDSVSEGLNSMYAEYLYILTPKQITNKHTSIFNTLEKINKEVELSPPNKEKTVKQEDIKFFASHFWSIIKPVVKPSSDPEQNIISASIGMNNKELFDDILLSDLDFSSTSIRTGLAPVHLATLYALNDDDFYFIDKLIADGSGINSVSRSYLTPLTFALTYAQPNKDILANTKKIVERGADLSIKDDKGRSVLFYAFPKANEPFKEQDNALITYLVEQGVNPALRDNTGLTASEFYGQRRNEFLVAKTKTEEAEKKRLVRVEADRRSEELRRQEARIAQREQELWDKQEKARKDAMIKNTIIGMGNIIADGIRQTGNIENQIVAESNRIHSARQSYNDNIRANEEKRQRNTQQFKQEREQRIREGEAFAAQQSAEWNSFQKELELKYSKSNKTSTTASNTNSYSNTSSFDETKSSNNNSTEKDTRTKYIAKKVDITTSGGAWDTKEKAFEWLRETVSSNKLRRACDLTRIVSLDVQNVTYRKTDSGRFHAKGTALGYCEIPSSSSKYKSIGWCSAEGFTISERHGCALSTPM